MSDDRKIIIMEGATYIEHLDTQVNFIGSQITNTYGTQQTSQPQQAIAREAKKAGRRAYDDISQVTCLADMIDDKMKEKYQDHFDDEILPHLKSAEPSFNAMTIRDMEFDFTLHDDELERYKKQDVYEAFSIIAVYLKPNYGKEQLAEYLSKHIVGMTSKASFMRNL